MKYIVVVFSSRSDTMQFYNIIKRYGLYCSVINTPRSLSASCGVSTKIDARLINQSMQIINTMHSTTFKGIFEVSILNKKEQIKRIF